MSVKTEGGSEEVRFEAKSYHFFTDDISFQVVETKSGKKYYVTGYISVPEVDLVNDLVTEKGMKSMLAQLKGKDVLLDYDHDVWRTENNSLIGAGRIEEGLIDDRGVFIKAELNPDWKRFDSDGKVTMTFSELWRNIKSKFIKGFSIAFKPIKTASKVVNGTAVRLLDDFKLLNVALTANPVCAGAKITGANMKSGIVSAINDFDSLKEKGICPSCGCKSEEVNKMAEEESKPTEAPVEEEKPEEETPVEEEKEEEAPEVEEKSEEKEEEKSEDMKEVIAQLKSMEDKITKLESENKKLKDSPILKSKIEEEESQPEEKSLDIFGMIR